MYGIVQRNAAATIVAGDVHTHMLDSLIVVRCQMSHAQTESMLEVRLSVSGQRLIETRWSTH